MAKIFDKVKFFDKVKIIAGDISASPTYSLQRSVAPVEGGGSSITFTVNTTDVENGTPLPYTISGVSQSDVTSGSLTGSFAINDNTASVTLGVSLEPTSPGVGSASLALDNGAASISVFPAPTYSLSRSATSVDEGSSVTFTLTTTGVANGTSVPYSISGITEGDLSSGSLTGNFVVNEGSAEVTVALASDALTDGSETISITAAGQSSSASVNDTSLTPNPFLTPTYTLSRSSASFNEGSSVTFTLTTTNVADGANVPYSVTGISAGDLSAGSLTGNFVINNGSAALTLTAASDLLSEGYETITIAAAGQTSTSTINDTSVTVPLTSTFVTKTIAFPAPGSNSSSSNLYAVSNNNKLYKSENMGSTWTMLAQLTGSSDPSYNTLRNKLILVSSDETKIVPAQFASGYTIDGGVTWSAGSVSTSYPWGFNPDLTLQTYVVEQRNSTTAYRIQRRSLFGATLVGPSDAGPSLSKWTAMRMSGNGLVVYASTMTALYKSADAGVTWNLVSSTGFNKLWCSYDGSKVYAQSLSSSSTSLLKSDDGGSSWINISPGGSYASWGGFSKDGSTILLGRFASSMPSRSLYLSQNSGTSWSLLTDVFPTKTISGSAKDDDVLSAYVNFDGTKLAIHTNHFGRLFTSEDSGATWSQKYLP